MRTVVTRPVAGGRPLYRAGDPPGSLYMVRAGALAVFRNDGMGRRLVGLLRPGEIVGEFGLLAGTARSATVVALRDSVVAEMPGRDFLDAARRLPDAMVEVARLLVARARSSASEPAVPRVVGLASLDAGIGARRWADLLAREARALGRSVAVLDAAAAARPPAWWSDMEARHDLLLCAAEADEEDWAAVCRRQVDRMLLFGDGTRPPPPERGPCGSEPLQANGLVDLVLVRDSGRPSGTAAWLDAISPARHHHVGPDGGCAPLARSLAGCSVALVLSGGGARAFAHVGAVDALRRAGVPIDAVCGTSMGAIVAAGVAAGWDGAELDRRMRDAFVTTNPLDDVALPFVAMTRGRKVERRLAEHFGEVDIADLPVPFFCVSADLGTGDPVVHRRGPLARALRASISLPGVLPPVSMGEQVLVDGGVLRNLPSELMRAAHDGVIVASDVSHAPGLRPADVERPRPLGRWFWSGSWRRGPPIVSILMRSATLAAGPDLIASRAAADLYVMPEVGGIEIREWRAYDRAVAAGRRAMTDALAGLDTPVHLLRRERMARAVGGGM
jgi:NTE family protein